MDTKAPQRDDPCFAGDNAAYRKAYKAWHARAKTLATPLWRREWLW